MFIKSFTLFESNSDINAICKKYEIEDYSINPDESIDVDGDVNLGSVNLFKLPLKFRHVSGNFTCYNNHLTSLEGCPQSIDGHFDSSYNQITSLEGCPQIVGENFYCHSNQLTSLKGCPKSIDGNFYCHNNQITSLEGCPQIVGENFYCHNNQLTSLKGCPQSIGGDFYCSDNRQIKDFGDKPIRFRNLDCSGNPIEEIYCLNRCQDFVEYLIEYQVIRDGNKIVRIRLEKALEDSEWDVKNKLKFKNYELI